MEGKLRLSELNLQIKETLKDAFSTQIWVIAEIGELKINRTGHCYLELVEKDERSDKIVARARATIWSWQFRFIRPYFETTTRQELQAGLKVLVAVSIEFHEVYSFSLNIQDIDPTYTLGDLAQKRQEIINQLVEEGIFDMNKELDLAHIPTRIAIISSPTAAGYEDFMNQLKNNEQGYVFYTKLFPAYMQGNETASSIMAALEIIFNYEDDFDTVIIIRGGGAQMDLSSFDHYELALNIAQFPLPVLTGIGHEKDETIVDMVAHTKLKTPTAVAEFLIGKMDIVSNQIQDFRDILIHQLESIFDTENSRIETALRLLPALVNSRMEKQNSKLNLMAAKVKPTIIEHIENEKYNLRHYTDLLQNESRNILRNKTSALNDMLLKTQLYSKLQLEKNGHWIDELKHRLPIMVLNKFYLETDKLHWFEKNVKLLDPENILKRGYSITLKNGKVVKNASELNNGDLLKHKFFKGEIKSTVTKNNE